MVLLSLFIGIRALSQPNLAIRQIKAGNTYREVNQYQQAEQVLLSGLNSIRQQKDRYWEAVACENLGFLYRDMEDSFRAVHYLDSASKIYKQLSLEGSHTALEQLLETIRNRTDAFAGIDIGSTGIKLSIIQVTLGSEGRYVYNIKKDSSVNANFADLNITAFEAGKNAVRELLQIMINQKIKPDNIFIAFSSGVLQEVNKKGLNKDSISNIFTQVTKSLIPSFNRTITFLTPDLEAKFTNIGVVLPRLKQRSVSIDMGGGNIKGGYYNLLGNFESFSLPFGTRFINMKGEDRTLPKDIQAELALFSQTPGIQNKREVFFLGGIIWAMINFLYPEKANADYVEFTYSDVSNFEKLTSGDYNNLVNYTSDKINRITDPEIANKAKNNLASVENTFTAENLRRGSLLFAGIMDELNIPTVKKRYYFLSKGSHIAWITGYVVSNIAEMYKQAKE
jgi:tetratricopeptide (TPR) repeat protein